MKAIKSLLITLFSALVFIGIFSGCSKEVNDASLIGTWETTWIEGNLDGFLVDQASPGNYLVFQEGGSGFTVTEGDPDSHEALQWTLQGDVLTIDFEVSQTEEYMIDKLNSEELVMSMREGEFYITVSLERRGGIEM